MKKFNGTKINRHETLLQAALKNSNGPQKELQTAWDSLGKAKSLLRQVDDKMVDISKPSSADVLYNLPDFLYGLIDFENLAEIPGDVAKDHSSMVDSVAPSPKRKISCIENRENSRIWYEASYGTLNSSAIDFLKDDSKKLSNLSTFSSDNIQHPKSKIYQNSVNDTQDLTVDVTSSTAIRDTDIRFLNDVSVPSKRPVAHKTANPPQFYHVDVTVPDARDKPKSYRSDSNVKTVVQQTVSSDFQMIPERDENVPNNSVGVNQLVADNWTQPGLKGDSDSLPVDAVMMRKVAYGPAAPMYKGFNGPLNYFKPPHDDMAAEWINGTVPCNNIPDGTSEPGSTFLPTSDSVKKRVMAVGRNKAQRNDIISTNSWRAGVKLQRDLGLTFPSPAKSETTGNARAEKEAKEQKGKDDDRLSKDALIPDIAKSVLKDMLTEDKENANDQKKPTTKKYFKKKPPPAEKPKEKQEKVLLYDASEARKFIHKQKEQRRMERMQKKETEMNTKTERLRRLEELSKHQREAAAKCQHRRLDESKSYGLTKSLTDTDSFKDGSDGDDDVDRTVNDNQKLPHQQRGIQHVTSNQVKSQSLLTSGHVENRSGGVRNYFSDEDLTPQEIVNRFALKKGLTLEDVVTNYTKYADEIIRSFIATDDQEERSKMMKQKMEIRLNGEPHSAVPGNARLEAIFKSSKSLQSRIQAETRKIATDPVMDPAVDVTLAPKTFDASDFGNVNNEVDVFGSDLPGSRHAPNYVQSSGRPSSGVVKNSQQVDIPRETKDASYRKEIPNNETCPFYLRSTFQPPMSGKEDSMFLIPMKPVPVFDPSSTEADPLSVLNIFNKQRNGMKITKVDNGTLVKSIRGTTKVASNHGELETESERYMMPSYGSASSKFLESSGNDVAIGPEENDQDFERQSIILMHNHPEDNNQMENVHLEMIIDDQDDMPPNLTQRSDPWPITQGSETNRSDAISYTADFTETIQNEADGGNSYMDEFSDDHSGPDSADEGQSAPKKRRQDEASTSLATNTDVSPLTNSDALKEESDFSDVTSVTLDSALLNQNFGSTGVIQQSLPMVGLLRGQPILAPEALEAKMLAELNLLDSMDQVLHQVNSMERTRAVATTQQETVALAQILKARQQSQRLEVEAARVQLEKDSIEETRRLRTQLMKDAEQEHDAAVLRIRGTTDAISGLQDSMQRLTQTQVEAAKLTTDAAKKLAETSTLILENQQYKPEMGQLLKESTAAAASAAVMSVMQQLQLQNKPTARKSKVSAPSDTLSNSSRGSHHRSGARSDQSTKSEKSYRTGGSSAHTSGNNSGSETTEVSSKRPKKTSSTDRRLELEDLSRRSSVHSVPDNSDIQTATEHTKSVVTGTDVSTNENSSISTESSEHKTSRSIATETVQSEKVYDTDYDSPTTEDDLDKSLREIVPSENQRKKIKEHKLKLDISSATEHTFTDKSGHHKPSHTDNSFDRFNVAMVQQYLKEEAVRHQHKQMLLQLRENALKEKTAAELAWLEQQKQKLRNKGSDDRYPELSKKQSAILRRHKKYQAELNRLKEANQLTLEAQKLLLSETRGIDKLKKSVQEVKQRLKNVKADESLPDLDITDEDLFLALPQDKTDGSGTSDDEKSTNDYVANENMKKSARRRLIEHEKKLKSKLMKFEKLLESPKPINEDKMADKKKTAVNPSPRPIDSARSIATATDAQTSARTDSASSHHQGSISENIATEHSGTAKTSASITEEISTARSGTTMQSSSLENSEEIKEEISEEAHSVASVTPRSGRKHKSQASHSSIAVPKKDAKKQNVKKSTASDSEDEFTLNQSVDFSGRTEVKKRIRNLIEELSRRKKEAEKLKKAQERNRLSKEEEMLKRKIEDYDSFIKDAKKELQSPSSTTLQTSGRGGSASNPTHTSSENIISESTDMPDARANEAKKPSISKSRKSQSKDSQSDTRRSMSKEVSEDLSVASLSTGNEKVLLDLDLDDPEEQSQRSSHHSVTPRSARSEARIPESARTLADIPEDYSLDDASPSRVDDDVSEVHGQNASQADHSERTSSKHSHAPSSEKSVASYSTDFSENSTKSKTTKTSEKVSNGVENTGSNKTKSSSGDSTEEDISEEILSGDESSTVASEEEKFEEMKILKDDDDDPRSVDDKVELTANATLPKDDDVNVAASMKKVKNIDFEAIANSTLESLLRETFDELANIKKRQTNIARTEAVSYLEDKAYPIISPSSKDLVNDKSSSDDDQYQNTEKNTAKQKLTVTEAPSSVLHNKEDVLTMVNNAVDLLWSNRTSDTSLTKQQYEATSLPKGDSEDRTAKSKASYSRLVLDLTAEALCKIHMDKSTASNLSLCCPNMKGIRHQIKATGLTVDDIKPTVQEQVLRCLGLAGQDTRHPKTKKFRRRRKYQAKKSDQLDEMVLEDLREEECEWIDYSQDELNVKMQLADTIFDSILQETVQLIRTMTHNKEN